MNIRASFPPPLLLSLLYFFQTLTSIASIQSDVASLNASNPIFFTAADTRNDNDPRPQEQQQQIPHFLEDVLKKISVMQRWRLEDIRVSNLNLLRKARIGTSKRYEVRLRVGKNDLIFGVSDDVVSWKKLKNNRGGGGRGGDFGSLIEGVRSISVLDSFKMEGPFELRVDADNELSLLLPMNTTHTGLRRILVGEGITVEVKGAQEVSVFCSSDLDIPVNKSFVLKKKRNEIWPLGHSSCVPLLPINILGSSSLVAYMTRNHDVYIETTFLSKEIIELLPEKCYSRRINRKWACPIDTLSLRIALMEKLFRSFLGGRYRPNGLPGSVKAKMRASTVVRFQLQLERHIGRNKKLQGVLAEWRTRPTVERNWFEIIARIEAEILKPVLVKKVTPFIAKDSIAWSNLMSNISFTKFPPLLVPPEALTLDVKW